MRASRALCSFCKISRCVVSVGSVCHFVGTRLQHIVSVTVRKRMRGHGVIVTEVLSSCMG
jgi:hypothetical protein|eukprot:COSAG02_NODE_3056_length_7455_cov_5.333469_7_plen_60_part_00